MEDLSTLVNDLFHFRDYFFTIHDVAVASEKSKLVEEKLNEVISKLDNVEDSVKCKAEYLMLRGKALSIHPENRESAEELLSKSVKLDPTLTEAWNCLGECYWTNNKIDAAKNCFLSSLNHKKDKTSLRNLSLITRSVWKDQEERKTNIDISLDLAKEALQLDLKDGLSWLSFGNANLAKYFFNQDPNFMKQSLSAYLTAEKDPLAGNSYDLHYNRGIVYEYLEEYEKALEDYNKTLSLHPTFSEASQKENQLKNYLNKLSELITTKGKIKGKRLKIFVSKINPTLNLLPHTFNTFKENNYSYKNLKDLNIGPNPKTVLLGKVVGSLFMDDRVCFTFCIVDKNEDCTAVTLYNALLGWGVKIDDSIAIPEPKLNRIKFSYKDKSFDFYTIRVDYPMQMLVNGKKPLANSMSPSVISSIIEQ